MTREEFEEWLDEHRDEALDNVQQSDTTPQKWLARLHASLKAMADEADEETEEVEEDPFVDEDDYEEEVAEDEDES
jgi:hypothetical protein